MEWSVSPKYSDNGKNGVFRYLAIDLHAEVLKKNPWNWISICIINTSTPPNFSVCAWWKVT